MAPLGKAKIQHQLLDLSSCACGRGDPGKVAVVGVGLKDPGSYASNGNAAVDPGRSQLNVNEYNVHVPHSDPGN